LRRQFLGKKNAVIRVFFFHSFPFKVLYVLVEKYPPNTPMRINKTTTAVARPPLFAGDKKPRTAKTITTTVIPNT